MLQKIRKKIKGQAFFEYVLLLIFVLAAFILFQKYIVRAMSGRWKSVGDSLGGGQLYDPDETVECMTFGDVEASWDDRFSTGGNWFRTDCFEANCRETCYSEPIVAADCRQCLNDCDAADTLCD